MAITHIITEDKSTIFNAMIGTIFAEIKITVSIPEISAELVIIIREVIIVIIMEKQTSWEI